VTHSNNSERGGTDPTDSESSVSKLLRRGLSECARRSLDTRNSAKFEVNVHRYGFHFLVFFAVHYVRECCQLVFGPQLLALVFSIRGSRREPCGESVVSLRRSTLTIVLGATPDTEDGDVQIYVRNGVRTTPCI